MPAHPLCLASTTDHSILRVLQLTDSHLLEDPNKSFAGIQPYQSLQAVLQHVIEHQQFDMIVTTGDIAQESTVKTYQQYFDAITPLKAPHFYIRGNHDSSAMFPEQQDKNLFQLILNGKWCFILINSQVDQHTDGRISPQQLEELSEILQKYQNYYVVLALHHHTFAVGCAWLDQHRLQNPEEFLACITPHQNVRAVIHGHVHQDFSLKHQHIQFLAAPSTFIQFKKQSDEFQFDNLPPGYRMLHLHPDGVVESQVHYLTEHVGDIDYNLSGY